ncbi:TPA: sulfatase-like hydrolase/transferase [Photobacterium damselae]
MELSRRKFLKSTAAVGAVTATSSCFVQAEHSTQHPNVLFLAVDDLNDWIGALGAHPQVKTPNLDRLYKRSTAFRNAHCQVPVCGPSRTALLTGMAPTTTGLYTNKELGIKPFDPVAEKVLGSTPVLPQHFKNNGYYTMASGKISHHGTADYRHKEQWDEEIPLYVIGPRDEHLKANGYGYGSYGVDDHKYYPFPVGGGQIIQSQEYGPGTRGFSLCSGALDRHDIPNGGVMPDEYFADWTVERLQRHYEKPFFLACGFIRPHVPYTAPREYFDMFPLESIIVPETIEKEMTDIPLMGKALALGIIPGGDAAAVNKLGIRKELVQAYLACIAFMDAQVGKVLDALENSRYANNTIVMFWGDHGQNFGEHMNYRKQTLWQESTRVPLMIRLPQQEKGQVCDEAVSLLDLYPTLIELCHLPKVATNEGISLKPLLNNPRFDRKIPAVTTYGYQCHAIRDEQYTYIRYRDGSEELYDRNLDPNEHHNLASDPNYQVAKQAMKQWLPVNNALPYGMVDFDKEGGDFITRILAGFEKEGIPTNLL